MSTDNLHDDAEFERFLAGEDALSRQLKGLAQAEPPAELDAAVFAKIEAAMAAEKVRQVETGPASNDPVGPPLVSQRKRSLARSLAYYWHWPVGVAAGILAVLAYRTAFEPYHPETVALNDTNMRVIAPTPHVTAPADVVTEPSRVATAPAVIVPPAMHPEPLPSAPPAAAQPAAAVASVREVPASANAPRADESVAEIAVSGVRPEALKPSVRFNVNDAGERAPVSEAGKLAAKEADKKATDDPVPAKPESGVELARTHGPAQDARDSLASNDSRAKLSDAPAAPPPVAALAPTPARERFGLNSPSAPSTGFSDARTVTPAAPQAERQVAAADTQEKQRKRAAAEQAHANPRKWLALIEQEIKDKDNQAALAEWDKFVAAYPAYKISDKLRADIESLRAQILAKPDAGK